MHPTQLNYYRSRGRIRKSKIRKIYHRISSGTRNQKKEVKLENLSSIIGGRQNSNKESEIGKFIIDYWRETETKKGNEIGKFIINYWRETEIMKSEKNIIEVSYVCVLRLLQKIMSRCRTKTEKTRPYYKVGKSCSENL
jgi:hypothetical protein